MWLRARAGWRSGSRRSNLRFPSSLQSRISSPGKHGNEQRGIRLHHRRRRLRRLRARQSPDRLGPAPRAAPRSGRGRPLDMDPHPGGHRPHPHGRARDLALPHRARREGQRAADLLAARARPGRLERRERHDLGARRPARVRHLGEPGQSRVGHAAEVLPYLKRMESYALGDPAVPRPRRPDAHHALRRPRSALRGLRRRGAAGGCAVDRGLQRPALRGNRLPAVQHAPRLAPPHRGQLPAPGAEPAPT